MVYMSENNGSSVFLELLRGRDGLPERDGRSKDFLDHQEKMGTIRAVISTPTKASLIKQGIRRYLGYQDTNH